MKGYGQGLHCEFQIIVKFARTWMRFNFPHKQITGRCPVLGAFALSGQIPALKGQQPLA